MVLYLVLVTLTHIAGIDFWAYVFLFQNFLDQAGSVKLTKVLDFCIAGFVTVFSKTQLIHKLACSGRALIAYNIFSGV